MTTAVTMTEETVREAFRRGDEERAFWAAHMDEFRAKYPDQLVAVKDGDVVAASKTLPELVKELEARGLRPTDVRVKFITVTPRHWAL